ncbi:hypothetical protein [Sorangium cellulosum]|uniref:Uncharacterized protein n=1 Tax=Sorangium cellulosum TaxID=56 RepID=A0A150Q2L8_SORCE|nr:hypothetical protein [Sorangium cellulosum]KYF62261.1 hypothetical protein BE15_05955 [Sorangium cellulosum]
MRRSRRPRALIEFVLPIAGLITAIIMHFRLDQLGKNILRDFFVLVGAAETEVEVPPGDAQRIDIWHVPDPELLRAHPEIQPGLLRSMKPGNGTSSGTRGG